MVDTIKEHVTEQESSIPILSPEEKVALIDEYIRREGSDKPKLGWTLSLLEEVDKLESSVLQVIEFDGRPKDDPQRLAEAALAKEQRLRKEAQQRDQQLLQNIRKLARMGRRGKHRFR